MTYHFIPLVIAACIVATASGLIRTSRVVTSQALHAQNDQTVKDLNLEEMFDVFNKADATVAVSNSKVTERSKVLSLKFH